jgi:hypothetical protein
MAEANTGKIKKPSRESEIVRADGEVRGVWAIEE